MTKYISYLRQSTQKQRSSGLGIEAQREIIENHISDKTLIAEFIETESGRKTDRPQLIRALEQCRKCGATLIVAKLDRLSRNVAFTSKLLESDIEIIFCDFPEANKLVLHIIASIAEYEAGLISQRTRQSLAAKRARGAKLGSPQNLLSRLDQAVERSRQTNHQKALDNPNNRRAVAMLKTLTQSPVLEGAEEAKNLTPPKTPKTLTHLAKELNGAGFTTAKGCQFTPAQVRTLLIRHSIPRA